MKRTYVCQTLSALAPMQLEHDDDYDDGSGLTRFLHIYMRYTRREKKRKKRPTPSFAQLRSFDKVFAILRRPEERERDETESTQQLSDYTIPSNRLHVPMIEDFMLIVHMLLDSYQGKPQSIFDKSRESNQIKFGILSRPVTFLSLSCEQQCENNAIARFLMTFELFYWPPRTLPSLSSSCYSVKT